MSFSYGPTKPAVPAGFMALFKNFPSTTNWTTAKNNAAAAANPWMAGARFWMASEGLCQTSAPASTLWDTDKANLAAATHPFSLVATRMSCPSSSTFDVTTANSLTYLDSMVAGAVSVMQAAGTTHLILDPENYSTTYMLFNFGQGAATTQLYNPGGLTRAQMAVKMQDFGRKFGLALWSRIPNATLHLLFGPTQIMVWTGTPSGTQMPATQADTAYDTESALYNLYPYFCLGVLDACPPTGRILDYCEGGCYGFSGFAHLQRVMHASNNWVSVYFPAYTGLVAKQKLVWRAVPILYPDVYFKASGSWYAGADFTKATAGSFTVGKVYKILTAGDTNFTLVGAANSSVGTTFTATGAGSGTGTAYCVTDQIGQFTRNAFYALALTPEGYMPGVYTDLNLGGGAADPWGQVGAVTQMDSVPAACLNNALALFQGRATWSSLGIDLGALFTALSTAFTSRTDYKWECQ